MENKRLFKKLRMLMAAASAAGFVGGWVLLAQAGKRTVLVSTQPAAVQVQSSLPSGNGLVTISQPAARRSTSTRPMLITRAS